MTNRRRKRCSISLLIRTLKIKTTIRYSYTAIKWPKLEKTANTKYWLEKWLFSYLAGIILLDNDCQYLLSWTISSQWHSNSTPRYIPPKMVALTHKKKVWTLSTFKWKSQELKTIQHSPNCWMDIMCYVHILWNLKNQCPVIYYIHSK